MATKKEYLFMPESLYEAVRWGFVLTPYITLLLSTIITTLGAGDVALIVAGIGAAVETFFTSLHMVSKKITDKRSK